MYRNILVRYRIMLEKALDRIEHSNRCEKLITGHCTCGNPRFKREMKSIIQETEHGITRGTIS